MLSISNLWNGTPSSLGPENDYKINIDIDNMTGEIILIIDAPFFNDPPPTLNHINNSKDTKRYIGLWNYEVVEVFISDCRGANYLEINIGPFGHYYLKSISTYDQNDMMDIDREPTVKINAKTNRWNARFYIPYAIVPEPDTGFDMETPLAIKWHINAFAIHGNKDSREYLAATALPGKSPNFHQPKFFEPFIISEKNEMMRERLTSFHSYKRTSRTFTKSSSSNNSGDMITSRLLQDISLVDIPLRKSNGDAFNDFDSKYAQQSKSSSSNTGITNYTSLQSLQGRNTESFSEGHNMISSIFFDYNSNKVISETEKVKLLNNLLIDGEIILISGIVWKRRGWSHKRRLLCLTSASRLFYATETGKLKGTVPWTSTQPINVRRIDNNRFDIIVHNNSRTYHFNDKLSGSDRWVTAITQLINQDKPPISILER